MRLIVMSYIRRRFTDGYCCSLWNNYIFIRKKLNEIWKDVLLEEVMHNAC